MDNDNTNTICFKKFNAFNEYANWYVFSEN